MDPGSNDLSADTEIFLMGRDGRKIFDQMRGPKILIFWIFEFFGDDWSRSSRIAPNKVSTDSLENSLSVDTELDRIGSVYQERHDQMRTPGEIQKFQKKSL